MKKLIFILFLFPLTLFSQTNYYVSTSGNNGNPGTLELPWRNHWYACSQVTGGNNINTISGTYSEGTQWILASGVNMYALGGVRIESSFAATGQPLVKLESTNGWLHPEYIGHQEINGYTFDGNMTTYAAIYINFRHYVKIVNCNFIDFVNRGVYFQGMLQSAWTATSVFAADEKMPNYWGMGNEVYNCTFTNCAYMSGYSGRGNLEINSQGGIKIRDIIITQTARATGTNGYGIKCVPGFNKGMKIHDSHITCAPNYNETYNFAIETWQDLDECEIYDNVLQGEIDVSGAHKRSTGYGMWIHDNEMGFSSVQNHYERAICIEEMVYGVIISNNKINHVSRGIALAPLYPQPEHTPINHMEDIWIYNNLITNIGEVNGYETRWTLYGIYGGDYQSNHDKTIEDCHIVNNVITASGDYMTGLYAAAGITLPAGVTTDDFEVKNNIITGFTYSGSYKAPIICWGTTPNTNVEIDNNLIYNCSNSNNVLFSTMPGGGGGTYVAGSGYSETDNIKGQNPLFVGGSPYDYHLQEESPAIAAGTWVDVLKDFEDKDYYDPPSQGIYETGTTEPEPEPEPEPGTGQIWTDGLGNIIVDGLGNVLKK